MRSDEDEDEPHVDKFIPTLPMADVMALCRSVDSGLDAASYFVPCSIFASVNECNDLLDQQAKLQELLFNTNNVTCEDGHCFQMDRKWSECDAQHLPQVQDNFIEISGKLQGFLGSLPSSSSNDTGIASDIALDDVNCSNDLCESIRLAEQSYPQYTDGTTVIKCLSCGVENCTDSILPNSTNSNILEENQTASNSILQQVNGDAEWSEDSKNGHEVLCMESAQDISISEALTPESIHIALPINEELTSETKAHSTEVLSDTECNTEDPQGTEATSMQLEQLPRSPRSRALSCPEFRLSTDQVQSNLEDIPEHPLENNAQHNSRLLFKNDPYLAECDIEGELQDLLDSIVPLDSNADSDIPRRASDDLPWSTLLMYGLDDPNRMTFTQSLAFPVEPVDVPMVRKRRRDAHVEAERRFNNYAKIITLVIFVLAVSSVVGFLYKILK